MSETIHSKPKKLSRSEISEIIPTPSHVNVIYYHSKEWDNKVRQDKALKVGRGVAMSLWGRENDERYPTTFVGKSAEEVREEFMNLCIDEDMKDVESKFYQKFGGFGALPFEEWADKVIALFPEKVNFSPDIACLAKAIHSVRSELLGALAELGLDKLQPLTVEESLEKIKKGANSGYPYFSNKWSDRELDGTWKNPDMVNYYVNSAKSLLNGADNLVHEPYVLFKRVSNNGINTPKMRAIEAPSKAEALAGKCIADPLVQIFKTLDTYWGMNGGDNCSEKVQKLFDYDYVVEGDFSAFDNTAGPLMPFVFRLLKDLTPSTHHQFLDNLLKYYQYPTLLTPMGLLSSSSPSGLMSGSSLTSVIGTLTNSIAVKYVMNRMGSTEYKHLAFGDDIALGTNKFDLEAFEAHFYELGLLCNKEKQSVSTGEKSRVSFLGYYHFKSRPNNTGVFPIMRAAPGLFYRESFVNVDKACSQENIDSDEFANEDKIGIDLISFVSKLNNLRNNGNFSDVVEYFRNNEAFRMDTDKIVPFERLQMAVRCGRTSRQMGLESSPTMIELYKLEKGGKELNLEPSTLEEKVTIVGNLVILQIVDTSLDECDPKHTVYTRTINTSVDDYEKALIRLENKLIGLRVLTNRVEKKVREPKEQTAALTFELVKLIIVKGEPKYLPKSKKYELYSEAFSPLNGKLVKTFTVTGEDEEEVEAMSAKLVAKFEEKVTKSNQLFLLVTSV